MNKSVVCDTHTHTKKVSSCVIDLLLKVRDSIEEVFCNVVVKFCGNIKVHALIESFFHLRYWSNILQIYHCLGFKVIQSYIIILTQFGIA